MVKLVLLTGPRGGETIEIDGECVIGRSNADITIEDPKLSRRHAVIRPVEGGVEVEDLGSLNGTTVDGQPITAPVRLTGGERLKLGDTTAEFELEVRDQPTRLDRTGAELGATVIELSPERRAGQATAIGPTPDADTASEPAAAAPSPPVEVPLPTAAVEPPPAPVVEPPPARAVEPPPAPVVEPPPAPVVEPPPATAVGAPPATAVGAPPPPSRVHTPPPGTPLPRVKIPHPAPQRPRVAAAASVSPVGAFAPPAPRHAPRHAATLLWGPTAASVAIIVLTAIAEVIYFAAR